MTVRFRIDEGGSPQPLLLWDSVWNPANGEADWQIAEPDETLNAGGLRAKAALHTAIALALFTNVRCPDDHPLRYLIGDDQQGWWGDGVDVREDLGETSLGSLLWMLERAPLTFDIVNRWAKSMTEEALAPLIAQGVAARIEVETAGNELRSRLDIIVRLYSQDGRKIFDDRWDAIWQQTR